MNSRGNVAEETNVSSKAIRKKVKNTLSIALKRHKLDSYILVDLDKVLDDVYCSFRPVSADYDTRKELVKNLNAMAIDIYGDSEETSPVLEAYGSFVMDTFSMKSDLDVSINFGNGTSELPREKKLQILKRFAKKLRSLEGQGHVRNVESIFSARVPIVKFSDQGTAIECDLSVENEYGILNSQIIRIISQIDDRFQKLCMLVKHWAKAHEVNSALHRTLNSVSIILLVALHLQTQNPPILPPFSMLFKDGIDPPKVEKRMQKFLNWGQRNQESLGRLFATFFIKLQSVEFLWRKGLCVSVLNGLWMCKKWEKVGVGSISVEDFTDVSQNVARRVNGKGAKRIYSSINRTVKDIFEFLNDKVAGTDFRHRLFGQQAVAQPPPVAPLNGKTTGIHRVFGQQAAVEPSPPVSPLNGKIYETDLKHSLFCQQAAVEPPSLLPLNGKVAETNLKHSLFEQKAVVEPLPVSPLKGKIAETDLKHSKLGQQTVVEPPPMSPLNGKIAETHFKHSLFGQQTVVEPPPPVLPLNCKIAETDLKHSLFEKEAVVEPPSAPSLNGKIIEAHHKRRLFGQQAVVERPPHVLPLNVYPQQPHYNYRKEFNGHLEEYHNKRVWLENGYRAVGGTNHGSENIFENPRGKQNRYAGNCNDFEDFYETHVPPINGKFAGTHVQHSFFGQQAVVERPPHVLPFNVYPQQLHNNYRNEFNGRPEEYHNKRVWLENGYRAVGGTSHGREEIFENPRGKRNRYAGNCNDFEEFHETPPVLSLNGIIAGTHLKHRLFDQQAVVEPPHMLSLNAYPQQPHNNYRNEFNGRAEEQYNKRVCLENGYRAVGGTSHGREEIYENPSGIRNRYAGNWNGFEEFHEIPRFEIHNKTVDVPYRQVLNIGGNGHLVHHRHDGRFSGEEPMPVGLWHDYSRSLDLPPPPPPPYDRVSFENFGPQNFAQPYFSRPFY